jgi:transposase
MLGVELTLSLILEDPLMQARQRRRPAQPVPRDHLGQPRGLLSARVQAVGPEHFGIVAIDPAKNRSCWMLADFYGRILVEPTVVEHRRDALDHAIAQLRQVTAQQDIRDLIVAVERTGRYHLPVVRAYAAAGWETRIVHPNVSCHFRRVGSYDTKTDPIDANAGIFRAAVNGFGLQEPPRDPLYAALQLRVRQRRDLVEKESLLCNQILEHLQACLPGYAGCFDNIFNVNIGLVIPTRYATPAAVAQAGLEGLTELARLAQARVQQRTLLRILGWAQNAPTPDPDATLHQDWFLALNSDRTTKLKQIRAVERQIVGLLVQTPYVRLLALAGINVVNAAELAGEAGPMAHYATARILTGRAGLYPRRYQSDRVDTSGGLARRGNRRLRQALLWGADTLMRCNDHFRVLAAKWADRGRDPRAVRVQVAGRYARIAFQMVTGSGAFRHPACQGPPAVLAKLIEYQSDHEIDIEMTRTNLRQAAARLPAVECQRERAELAARVQEPHPRRGRRIRRFEAIVSALLPRLGEGGSEGSGSPPSGEAPSRGDDQDIAITNHRSSHDDEIVLLSPPGGARPEGDGRDVTLMNHRSSHDDGIHEGTTRTTPAPPAARGPAAPSRGPADRSRRGGGPTPLGAILPAVLKQYLGGEAARVLESTESGETP